MRGIFVLHTERNFLHHLTSVHFLFFNFYASTLLYFPQSILSQVCKEVVNRLSIYNPLNPFGVMKTMVVLIINPL